MDFQGLTAAGTVPEFHRIPFSFLGSVLARPSDNHNGGKDTHFFLSLHRFMNFNGILVGAAVFLIIGICHPLVIKLEYRWGKRSWWVFLAAGLIFARVSLLVRDTVWSTVAGATAFSCFWGIGEMFQQEKRVLRGWFPENPARHDYYEQRRSTLREEARRRKSNI